MTIYNILGGLKHPAATFKDVAQRYHISQTTPLIFLIHLSACQEDSFLNICVSMKSMLLNLKRADTSAFFLIFSHRISLMCFPQEENRYCWIISSIFLYQKEKKSKLYHLICGNHIALFPKSCFLMPYVLLIIYVKFYIRSLSCQAGISQKNG